VRLSWRVLSGRVREAVERVLPEAVEVGPQGRDSVRVEAVDVARALPLVGDEAGAPQDGEVLRDRGTAHRELGRELADTPRPLPQPLHDRPARRVAEGVEC